MTPGAPGRGRQTALGLGLAAAIFVGWAALHLFGVFVWRPTLAGALGAPLIIAAQSWLGAGLFIVAHDAMHGSLTPGRAKLGDAIGQLCLGVYAGFSYAELKAAHHRHHAAPGSAEDPDFHAADPRVFRRWYLQFFRTYFDWREFAFLTVWLIVYLWPLHVSALNAALFWGLPALLSSLQLFVFGTWLPHRHERHERNGGFDDRHRARSLNYGWLGSLLACFHFGYHLEHHRSPRTPWWGLPGVRARARVHGGLSLIEEA